MRGFLPPNALLVVGLIGFIFVLWFASGAPRDALSRDSVGIVAYPVALGDAGDFRNAPGSGTQASQSGLENVSEELQEFFNNEDAERSPYAGKIQIVKSTSGPSSSILRREYIELRASQNNDGPIAITGWTLESLVSKKKREIPSGTEVASSGRVTVPTTIRVFPGEEVFVSTGRSPVGYSFRVNKCSGYFEQYQDFIPSISTYSCPRPINELKNVGLSFIEVGDECYDMIERYPGCTIQDTKDKPYLPATCHLFIAEELHHNACVLRHRNDADFWQDEWRVFLGLDSELWRSEREIIRLSDSEGRTVDVFTY